MMILTKAEKLELEGSLNVKWDPVCLIALEQLLLHVYDVSCPQPDEYHNRWDLVRVFNVMAKEIYGSDDEFPVVEAFGSFLMDVFSVKSDLDLSVNFSNDVVEFPRDKKISALRKFARRLYQLQSDGHVFGVHPIVSAKVPIVKVIDRGTGIECDISVENKDGILKSQIIHIISAIDPRFRMLSFLMKTWAKVHSINSSKDHTLNSLSIILLVAFHLQTRQPPILPPFRALFKDGINPGKVKDVVQSFLQYGNRNEESIAELFVAFLSKMASVESLWLEGLCASTYEGAWITKRFKKGHINVEDFSDRSQNVARSVGKAGAAQVYHCVTSSLHDILAFNNGFIQAHDLRTHLFDATQVRTHRNPAMKRKRRRFLRDSAAIKGSTSCEGVTEGNGEVPSCLIICSTPPAPLRRSPSFTPKNDYGWRPWGGTDQVYGGNPNAGHTLDPAVLQEQQPFYTPWV